MTQEEALNTLMKMRAWRAWGKEQKEEERPEMPEQKEVDEAFDVCIKLLQRSSLSSNLDDAADDAMFEFYGMGPHLRERPEYVYTYEQMIAMFKAGAEWQKKQMMKGAVEGYVNYYEDFNKILIIKTQINYPYHIGDKVKIIIVKEG